jgi:serine/threonine protein kinase
MPRLSHRNIVTLHEVIYVRQSRAVYLVLRYVGCGNLAAFLRRGVVFSAAAIHVIFRQVTAAVSYLHGNRIVHQDLKPENILLADDGTVLISDFGTGHRFHSCARGFGTPAYQAPELANRSAPEDEVEPGKEDIWSLRITLYFLHVQAFPFPGANVFEIAKAVIAAPVAAPSGCDRVLWDLVVGMLDPDPRKRFAIHDVLAHPYVAEAPESAMMDIPPILIPRINAELP